MKNLKKILALVLALTMVLSMSAVVLADGEATGDTFTGYHEADLTGHDYTAYQIFSGSQADGDPTLGDIVWGSGINSDDFLTALIADATIGTNFNAEMSAKDVAKAISEWDDDSAEAKAFARVAENNKTGNGAKPGDTLAAGYYLVVDVTNPLPEDGDPVWNLALLQLTQEGDFDINTKVEVPEVIKQVKEGDTYQDANQAAIGDTVNFKITTAVPAAAADYDYYYFIINDTLSAGLCDPTNFVVYIDGSASTAYTLEEAVVAADGTTSFRLALTDAKAAAGKAVVVTYDATLDEDAKIDAGNPNEVSVKYSNKPDEEYDGTTDGKGFPQDGETPSIGETPKDITLTFVTGIKLFKTDEKGNALTGAEFTLTGDSLNTVLVSTEVFEEAEGGAYYKLNDGTYTKDAPVEDAYVQIFGEDRLQGGYVIKNVDGTDVYVEASEDDIADENIALYKFVKGNVGDYASTSVKYNKSTKLVAQEKSDSVNIVGSVDDNGYVTFQGLNVGTYTIEETKVPAGYNKIADITVVITAELPDAVTTGEETCTWGATASNAITEENKTGALTQGADSLFGLTVVNQKGSTLPETGGIGTTIFYVLGSIMLAGAAILLITKKRMSAEA